MTTKPEHTGRDIPRQSNRLMLCVAWLVVGIPLAWGVFKSVEKSLPLFTRLSAATQAVPSNPAR